MFTDGASFRFLMKYISNIPLAVVHHQVIVLISVASYTNKMVDMFTSESSKEVTLLCENELMRVIIDHYGEDAAVDRYDDTHFTAKIEVNPSGTFYGWIFKFKGKIKILSPKECITEMQQIAQEFI